MKLPLYLKPKKNFKLIRIGKNHDGGYLVCLNSLKNSNFLISMGIYDDWSFEKEFLKKNKKIKIKMFDQTLSFFFLIKRFFIEFIKIFVPGRLQQFPKSITNLYEYFFFVKSRFKKKKINKKNFNQLIKNQSNKIFLKIDIEGSEYEILDIILRNKKKIEGIAIEFHDIYKNINLIKKFIKKIDLKLIHIHPNNFKQNNPDILELSFAKNPNIIGNKFKFPNPLDMNNDPRQKKINMKFKK